MTCKAMQRTVKQDAGLDKTVSWYKLGGSRDMVVVGHGAEASRTHIYRAATA